MKRRQSVILLAETAVCIAIWKIAGNGMGLMTFPFSQIAMGLRELSLSGNVGNGVAVAVYWIISLLPEAVLLIIRHRRALVAEDTVLVLLSVLLFWGMFAMINPGTQVPVLQLGGGIVFVGAIWATLLLYLTIRLIRWLNKAQRLDLLGILRMALYGLQLLFVWQVTVRIPQETVTEWKALLDANCGTESSLTFTYVSLLLRAALKEIPCLFDVILTIIAINLTKRLEQDQLSAETVKSAERLGSLSAKAVAVSIGSTAVYNVLQLLFAPLLRSVDSQISIPVLPVIFALIIMLAAAILRDNRRLKSDNDLFI